MQNQMLKLFLAPALILGMTLSSLAAEQPAAAPKDSEAAQASSTETKKVPFRKRWAKESKYRAHLNAFSMGGASQAVASKEGRIRGGIVNVSYLPLQDVVVNGFLGTSTLQQNKQLLGVEGEYIAFRTSVAGLENFARLSLLLGASSMGRGVRYGIKPKETLEGSLHTGARFLFQVTDSIGFNGAARTNITDRIYHNSTMYDAGLTIFM